MLNLWVWTKRNSTVTWLCRPPSVAVLGWVLNERKRWRYKQFVSILGFVTRAEIIKYFTTTTGNRTRNRRVYSHTLFTRNIMLILTSIRWRLASLLTILYKLLFILLSVKFFIFYLLFMLVKFVVLLYTKLLWTYFKRSRRRVL